MNRDCSPRMISALLYPHFLVEAERAASDMADILASLCVPVRRGGTQTNSLGGALPRPQIFLRYPTFVFALLEALTFGIFTP